MGTKLFGLFTFLSITSLLVLGGLRFKAGRFFPEARPDRVLSESVAAMGPGGRGTGSAAIAEALERVFGDTVRPVSPPVMGDFNGDGSEDVAILVRPDERSVGRLTDPYANWILEAPRSIPPPRLGSLAHRGLALPSPARIDAGCVLVAVIHGFGANGWHDDAARQAYVLCGVAGALKPVPLTVGLKGVTVFRGRGDLRGDGLEDVVASGRGYLYWDGAQYAWLPET